MEVTDSAGASSLRGGSLSRRYLGGDTTSHAHPAKKHKPPTGVIAPMTRMLVNPIVYKLPLKMMMPANNSHQAPRLVDPDNASTKSAIA